MVLPAMTRYEQPGGGTSTSTERMVYFSPEIAARASGKPARNGDIYVRSGRAGQARKRAKRSASRARHAIREEIALAAPNYDGIQHLSGSGRRLSMGRRLAVRRGRVPDAGRPRAAASDRTAGAAQAGRAFLRDDSPRQAVQFHGVQPRPIRSTAAERYDVLMHTD